MSGKSSRLYKNIVDDKKMALQIGALITIRDYGTYILYGLPQAPFTSENILLKLMLKL
jgi:hypothetical protein